MDDKCKQKNALIYANTFQAFLPLFHTCAALIQLSEKQKDRKELTPDLTKLFRKHCSQQAYLHICLEVKKIYSLPVASIQG